MRLREQDDRLQRAMAQAAHILYPQGEQDGAAKELCAAFGVPSLALEASEDEMQGACRMPCSLAFAYSIVPSLSRYMLAQRAAKIAHITDIDAARAHLLPMYLGTHYECGHILCLSAEGRLLGSSPLRMGSVDEAPFYVRVIIENALQSGGEAFILAHNHPAGTHSASTADCESTLTIMDAMHKLDLTLIDHIIITDGDAVSIRASGQIDPESWAELAPLPPAFRDWPR